ncbi:MAG: hypothetical protein IPL50_19250 [Chitinophagaceae bacterium]|nr:hypothetical protein [Chitinophagaceae bacterium]
MIRFVITLRPDHITLQAQPRVLLSRVNDNPAIGLAAAGAGNIPAFTATNATTAPINATITVTPTVGACVGTPMLFIIRVNPAGQVNPIANQVLCRGASTAPVNFTTTVPGTVFSWSNDNTSSGWLQQARPISLQLLPKILPVFHGQQQ